MALYGIDYLIEKKQSDFVEYERHGMKGTDFRLREEIADQIRALNGMKEMAESYGYDIPNRLQMQKRLYSAVLRIPCSDQDSNGAAMSVGRISTFLDIYIQRVWKKVS